MAAPAVRSRADLSFAVGRLCELELAEVRFCIDADITNSVRLRIVDGRFGPLTDIRTVSVELFTSAAIRC